MTCRDSPRFGHTGAKGRSEHSRGPNCSRRQYLVGIEIEPVLTRASPSAGQVMEERAGYGRSVAGRASGLATQG
jgi:hypothetical protein